MLVVVADPTCMCVTVRADDLWAGDSFHDEPLATMSDLRVYNKILDNAEMQDVLRRKTGL